MEPANNTPPHIANNDQPQVTAKPLQVAATRLFGPFDSSPHGGGTLTLIDQTITYTPKSSKVKRVRLAVNDIVRINMYKTRLELYTTDGKKYKFFVTVPHGMGYVNTTIDDPISAAFAAVDAIGNIHASNEYVKDSRKVANTWQPWLERITALKPTIAIEHKNRNWNGPVLFIGITLVCIAIFVAIILLTQPS